jgi:hypothetical protein
MRERAPRPSPGRRTEPALAGQPFLSALSAARLLLT